MPQKQSKGKVRNHMEREITKVTQNINRKKKTLTEKMKRSADERLKLTHGNVIFFI